MFPINFSLNVISNFSNEGDWVLDPFSGRGTTMITAEMLGRHSTGIEISKLGWIYSSTKLYPAPKNKVSERLKELYHLSISVDKYKNAYKDYDEFFSMCYCPQVLNFLTVAKEELNWEEDHVDRTLMTFIVVNAHGEYGQTLSNQMQHVKACGPNYAIKWWKAKNYLPPEINPGELLEKKLDWRYKKGVPKYRKSKAYLGESTEILSQLKGRKYKLLFTSPPYQGVTDYYLDQWIRLWLLGGQPYQKFNPDPNKNNFSTKEHYYNLLFNVFLKSKKLLKKDASLYIRTDARTFSKETTISILDTLFSETKNMEILNRPFTKRTQTALHGDTSQKPGEVDIILTPK